MKRFLIISYWVVSILLVAVVLTSIGYRFLEALFIGSMFLPGALAAKYFFPKVRGVKDTVFLVLGILMAEILLFLIAHYLILTYRENLPLPMWDWPDLPQILTNPVFIALILTTLAAGSYFFESWLDRKRPTRPAPITFTSDRKPVTLPLDCTWNPTTTSPPSSRQAAAASETKPRFPSGMPSSSPISSASTAPTWSIKRQSPGSTGIFSMSMTSSCLSPGNTRMRL